jgi:hypothetical protein
MKPTRRYTILSVKMRYGFSNWTIIIGWKFRTQIEEVLSEETPTAWVRLFLSFGVCNATVLQT